MTTDPATVLQTAVFSPIAESTLQAADDILKELRLQTYAIDEKALADLKPQRMLSSMSLKPGFKYKEGAPEMWEQASALTFRLARDATARANPEQLVQCIKDINRIMKPDDDGNLRRHDIGGGLFPMSEIHTALGEYIEWLFASLQEISGSKGKQNPVVVAAVAYQWLNSIHPFKDGNGRTSQMVMDLVLLANGLPPAALGDMHIDFIPWDQEVKPHPPTVALARVVVGLRNSESILRTKTALKGKMVDLAKELYV